MRQMKQNGAFANDVNIDDTALLKLLEKQLEPEEFKAFQVL